MIYNKVNLTNALKSVSKVVSNRVADVFGYFLLEQDEDELTVTASNGNVQMRTTLSTDNCGAPFSVCIDAEVLKQLPLLEKDTVQLILTDHMCEILCGASKVSHPTMPADSFHTMNAEDLEMLDYSYDNIKTIAKLSSFCDNDSMDGLFNSVLSTGDKLLIGDRFRLSLTTLTTQKNIPQFAIPPYLFKYAEVKRDSELYIGRNNVMLKSDNIEVLCIQPDVMNFSSPLNVTEGYANRASNTSLSFSRVKLIRNIKTALISASLSNLIHLSVKDNHYTVSSECLERNKEAAIRVNIYSGGEFNAAVDGKNLINVLNAFESDTVQFGCEKSTDPIIISSDEDDFKFVFVPRVR